MPDVTKITYHAVEYAVQNGGLTAWLLAAAMVAVHLSLLGAGIVVILNFLKRN